jgi:hypothetical protein
MPGGKKSSSVGFNARGVVSLMVRRSKCRLDQDEAASLGRLVNVADIANAVGYDPEG